MLPVRRPSNPTVATEANRLAREAALLFSGLQLREVAEVWRFIIWETMREVGELQEVAAEQIDKSWS
jgi:hypothetical protein